MNSKLVVKLVIMIIGSAIMGLGIGFAILSGYVGDAISVFSEGIANTFNITLVQHLFYMHVLLVIATTLF